MQRRGDEAERLRGAILEGIANDLPAIGNAACNGRENVLRCRSLLEVREYPVAPQEAVFDARAPVIADDLLVVVDPEPKSPATVGERIVQFREAAVGVDEPMRRAA